MTGSPVSCKELFLRKGSHKEPLFRMFPLSLQSTISNQMRPQRLKGAWFSRLLRHPARRRSGSILSPGTHTEFVILCRPITISDFWHELRDFQTDPINYCLICADQPPLYHWRKKISEDFQMPLLLLFAAGSASPLRCMYAMEWNGYGCVTRGAGA